MVSVNFLSLVASAFAISLFTSKIPNRLTFLKYWIFAGILISPIFAVVTLTNPSNILGIAAIVGAYFGLGMPTCMGYYAKNTEPQNRAKSSGIIILILGIGLPLILISGSTSAIYLATALSLWRLLALVAAYRCAPIDEDEEIKQKVTFRSVLSNKTFVLYAIPWLMFSLINDLTMQININYFSSGIFPEVFGQNFILIGNILAGASALVCGVIADKKGRKRVALAGFVLLGVGYASLGLFSGNYFTAVMYVCLDGVAWGALSMLFLLTIWGDIAKKRSSEKFYVLGVLPYLLSNITRTLFGTYIATAISGENMIFSFASFFLFISILPLAYAPETLSDKIIKNLELNSYLSKAIEKANKDKPES